jgi:hypothetical protein
VTVTLTLTVTVTVTVTVMKITIDGPAVKHVKEKQTFFLQELYTNF